MMMRLLLFLLTPLLLFGLEAKVELQVNPDQELFVSKKLIVTLKVMSTGFKMDDLNVDFGKNQAFIIIAPESAAYTTFEDDFNVVVYEYELYPLEKGRLTLAPWTVHFSSSLGYGMKKEYFVKKSHSKRLNIRSVRGYDFLLATPKLSATTTFIAKSNTLHVGDAVSRKIVLKAYDVPDILIPNVEVEAIEGIQVYSEEPQLSQRKEQDRLISTRVQEDVFVLTKEGNYTIPSSLFYWYNTETKRVRKEYTKRFSFEVKAAPKPDEVVIKESVSNKTRLVYAAVFIGSIAALWLLYRLYTLLRGKQRRKLERYDNSSVGRLDALIRACDKKDVIAVYNGFYRWAESLGLEQVNLKMIAKRYPELTEDLDALELALNSGSYDFDRCQTDLIMIKKSLQDNVNKTVLLERINPKDERL